MTATARGEQMARAPGAVGVEMTTRHARRNPYSLRIARYLREPTTAAAPRSRSWISGSCTVTVPREESGWIRMRLMSDRDDIPRYLENWQDEVDSAAEYRAMAAAEADPRLAKVYANLAAMEEAHISFWEDRLRKASASVPRRRPSWRSRMLGAIARRFGPEIVLPTIAAKEEMDQNAYAKQPENAGNRMPAHERWHATVLKQLVTSQPRGLQGSFLGRLAGRARSGGASRVRGVGVG